MSEVSPAPQRDERPENARLNALISAGVRGDATVRDVINELVNSDIFLGSSTAEVKGLADAKPFFLKQGASNCVVVSISRTSSARFVKQTPYFIALRASSLIAQMQANLGLYVAGETDAFILHPPEVAQLKAALAASPQTPQ